ncbi:hypothetical protein Vretifemale_18837 [Volvox reticuliferus]|uniref:Myb-like domain-containing protein n=1 Tax=Volvox reticuliferus TaxID=1737510 RepID=A0A8J4CY16_9CHLO|nr:hypothetical protein Vretifemale_18837 [Volvox reticuliferus]
MGTMTAPVGPTFLSVPLDVLVNRDLDKNGLDLLETLHKTSAATSTTASADMLLEPASKKQKLQSEQPVDSAEAALLRAGRKKPPWTPTEQAVVAIKHCELGNRWTQIAAYLPLRSENDVKNIWHSTLRCKDTQKRSFLRTYALAVHDHAYDYATRKAMFDIAVRQCGPPPPQASEMIARVQLLMDHPELQAAMQQQHMQQQEQQLLQQQQQQQDQLAQLTQLLQKRDELQHLASLHLHPQNHSHFVVVPQQQQLDGDGQDGDESEQNEPDQRKSAAALASKANDQGLVDVRRLLQSRDKFGGGKYDEKYGGDTYTNMDRAVDDVLATELERTHLAQLQAQGQGLGSHRNQAPNESLDPLRGNPDNGVSALRRYNAAMQGQAGNGSGGGAAPAAVNAGYPGPQADAIPTALANMAAVVSAAVAGEGPGAGGGGPNAAGGGAAGGGDGLPGTSRQPGVPLPALGNLLALLYKYNTEHPKQPGWPVNGGGGEEEGDPRVPDSQMAIDGVDATSMALVPTAAANNAASPIEDEDERGNGKAANTSAAAPVPSGTAVAMGSQGPQPLALRPLALRPLQPKREREHDVKDDEDEGADAGPSTGDRSAEGSPKRPASVRVAARRAQAAAAAAQAAAQAAATSPQQMRENGNGGGGPAAGAAQSGALRPRGSMPYSFQDADADELGAVEALALAARLNTSNVRTAPSQTGTGRTSGSNLPTVSNVATPVSGDVNRVGGAGGAALVGGGGASASTTAALGAGNLRISNRPGVAVCTGVNPPSGTVLDLHARPAVVSSQLQPPAPTRTLMRPSSDLHSPGLARQQQQQQQQRSASQTLDVISVLNMPGLRRQVLSLPAQTLVALLCSPAFGSDAEASVLLLVALWLQANKEKVTSEQARAVCGAVRLAALGGFYLSAVLPQLLTEPRVIPAAGKAVISANAKPGGRWFEMRHEELAFLTRYVHAGAAERALLADVARGVYDCSLPWYDMTPRYLGSPAEGFCFEWHIPEQGLRDALSNGTQPHAAFTVNDDISDSDGGSTDGSVAVVPYILCRGLEWHVFVDCQQHHRRTGGSGTGPGGAATGAGSSSVAGVFVYCRVPAALRSPGAGTSGFVGVVPGAGIRLGVHGWRCGRLEEVFVWTFGDETYFVPDAGMGCPSALPLRKRPSSPPGGGGRGGVGGGAAASDSSTMAWADYLHEGGLRGTLTFLPH